MIGKAALLLGILLIVGSLALLLWWQISIGNAAHRMDTYVAKLTERMPAPEPAILEERADNRMPSLRVDGNDFIGLLEFEGMAKVFPVGGDWSGNGQFPSRYWGSIYDGSLVIGASNQRGQINFAKALMNGDRVFLTDMTGNRYSFYITDIFYRKQADNEDLISEESDLTLFVKNIYGFEYIIIRCNAA